MIKILSTGLYTSIQDAGRFGYRHLGVPVSGCMDLYSFNLANALLNNSPECAVLESTLIGPRIEFLAPSYIAITGAQCHLLHNSHPAPINTVLKINKGDVIDVGKTIMGCRNYLAVVDGFVTESILNSQSQYHGITQQKTLQKNQLLSCNPSKRIIKNRTTIQFQSTHFNTSHLIVDRGPEFNLLSDYQINKIFSKSYSLSSLSNRMASLFHHGLPFGIKEIITSSVQPGTVQLTPSGQLIILMRDAQTTGGYSRILQLTDKSISQLSQLSFNCKIKFQLNRDLCTTPGTS